MKFLDVLRKIRKVIDTVDDFVGSIAKYVLLAILFCMTFEVIARYGFNSPTIWALDLSKQFLCALGALSGGYVMLYNQHVRVDVFYGSWSDRTKGIVDIITCGLYLIFMVLLVYQTFIAAIDSWAFHERAATVFAPPLYYIKTIIPIGACLILLQAIAKLFHDIIAVVTGESEDLRTLDTGVPELERSEES